VSKQTSWAGPKKIQASGVDICDLSVAGAIALMTGYGRMERTESAVRNVDQQAALRTRRNLVAGSVTF
jgi:hypothetical protein